jgi:cytochrome c553
MEKFFNFEENRLIRLRAILFFFSCLFLNPVQSFSETSESFLTEGYSKEEINRGKRFFMGLLPFERNHESCVSCHNLTPADTMNWNPSVMDIALKYLGRDSASFRQVVMEPTSTVMEASHRNFDISDEDLQVVKVYLDHLAVNGPDPVKPTINRLLLFLFLGLLLTWALLDLIFFKKVKLKIIPVVIFL